MSLYGLTSRTWVLDYTTNAHTYRLLIFKDLLFRNRTAVLVSLHRHQHRSEIMKHSHQFVKHFFKFIFQSTAKLKCPTNPLHRLSRRLSSRETRLWTSPQLLSIGIFINSCFLFNGRLARIPKPDRQGHLSLALDLQVFYMTPETKHQGRLIYSAQNRRGEMVMRCCTHGDHRRLGMWLEA